MSADLKTTPMDTKETVVTAWSTQTDLDLGIPLLATARPFNDGESRLTGRLLLDTVRTCQTRPHQRFQ